MKTDQEIGLEAASIARAEVLRVAKLKGITLERVLLKLKQALNAKETKVFKGDENQLIYSKSLIAHGPRLKAIELCLSLLDAMPSQKHELTGKDGGPLEIEYVNNWRNGNGAD